MMQTKTDAEPMQPIVVTHEDQHAVQQYLALTQQRKVHTHAASELSKQAKAHVPHLNQFLGRCPDSKLLLHREGEFLRTHRVTEYKPLTQPQIREGINAFCDENNFAVEHRNLFVHSLTTYLWRKRNKVETQTVEHVTPQARKRRKREEDETLA
jgi:hypothetical protein